MAHQQSIADFDPSEFATAEESAPEFDPNEFAQAPREDYFDYGRTFGPPAPVSQIPPRSTAPISAASAEPSSWYENVFTVPNALRFGGSALGSIAGAIAAPYTMGGSLGLIGAGGAAGEAAARWWEGKPFDPTITAVEGALNLIPGGGAIPGKGAALKEIGKYAARQAGHGAVQGAAGAFPRHLAEEGTLLSPSQWTAPSMGDIASQTVAGGVIGGGMGGAAAKYMPSMPAPKPKPKPTGIPRSGIDTPVAAGSPADKFVQQVLKEEPIPVQQPLGFEPAPEVPTPGMKARYYELVDKGTKGTLTADELVEGQRLDKILREHNFEEPVAPPIQDPRDPNYTVGEVEPAGPVPYRQSPVIPDEALSVEPVRQYDFAAQERPVLEFIDPKTGETVPSSQARPGMVPIEPREQFGTRPEDVSQSPYGPEYVGQEEFPTLTPEQLVDAPIMSFPNELVRQGMDPRMMARAEQGAFDPSTLKFEERAPSVIPGVRRTPRPAPKPLKPESAVTLPRELAGAKPRFNIGEKSYEPQFADDLDKALFIIAQENKSKADASYLQFVMEQTGLDEVAARQAGRDLRGTIKNALRGQEPGKVTIPPSGRRLIAESQRSLEPESPADIALRFFSEESGTLDIPRLQELYKKYKEGTITPEEMAEGKRIAAEETRAPIKPEMPSPAPRIPSGFTPAQEVTQNLGQRLQAATAGGAGAPPPKSPKQTAQGRQPRQPRLPGIPKPKPPVYGPAPMRPRKLEPPLEASMASQIWNLPRELQSVDLPGFTSAALRQSRPLAFTTDWFKAWGSALRATGSKEALDTINAKIANSKYFKPRYKPIMNSQGQVIRYKEIPSIAEELGVSMTDVINKREEAIVSSLATKIPGYGRYVKASERAYTAFLNDLRAAKFEQLMDGAKAMGRDPEKDVVLGKKIADFVNNATGRGSLKYIGGRVNLEPIADVMGGLLYSPRALSARLAFMNPYNYTKMDPLVRREYIAGLARIGLSWGAASALASFIPGVHVGLNPLSSDFGKIRIGNTRFDPGAGFQQLLVLASREAMGGTRSSDVPPGKVGPFTPFGSQGAASTTELSLAGRYIYNQLNPSLRFIFDMLNTVKGKKEPGFDITDRTLQLALPMYAEDIATAAEDDASVAEFFAPFLSSIGIGGQTYEKGNFNAPKITPFIKDVTGIDLPTYKIRGKN